VGSNPTASAKTNRTSPLAVAQPEVAVKFVHRAVTGLTERFPLACIDERMHRFALKLYTPEQSRHAAESQCSIDDRCH
jgi:hypothetical protein